MKTFAFIIMMLVLAACDQKDDAKDEIYAADLSFLKIMCDNRQSCLDKIDLVAMDCQTVEYESKNVDLWPKGVLIDPEFKAHTGFQHCVIQQMDDAFMVKFNQMIPITETNVQITASNGLSDSLSQVSYGYQDDTKVLQIEQQQGQFKINDTLLSAKEIKIFIKTHKLTESFDSAALIIEDDLSTGVLMRLIDELKKAGFNNTQIVRKERLDKMNEVKN